MFMNVISSLFSREVNRHRRFSPLLITFVSMGFGSLLMLAGGLIFQGYGKLTGTDIAIIAWLAVANTALAFTLWNRSLQVLPAVEASILNSLMMPQIALLAYLFLGEVISGKSLLGFGLVFTGVLVVQIRGQSCKM